MQASWNFMQALEGGETSQLQASPKLAPNLCGAHRWLACTPQREWICAISSSQRHNSRCWRLSFGGSCWYTTRNSALDHCSSVNLTRPTRVLRHQIYVHQHRMATPLDPRSEASWNKTITTPRLVLVPATNQRMKSRRCGAIKSRLL